MSTSDRRRLSALSIIILGLIISLTSGGLIVYAHYDAIRPGGSSGLLFLNFFAVLPLLLCAIAAPVAAAFCIPKWSRKTAAALLLSCLLVVGSVYSSMGMGRDMRRNAFIALAERSAVLVNAIKAYESTFGEPPESLSALVPDFIPAIPQTGMGEYPNYNYVAARGRMYDGNPWVLVVHTPTAIADFDQFMYYPLQNYPDYWFGNRLERIRDWAYLHE